jgi:hypothetical protein
LVGVVALGQGVVMFVAPSVMVDRWPWPLTPLTCRVMGAVFCLGCAGIVAWTDPRWSTVSVMVRVEVLMLALMLIAAVRARHELIAGRPLTWPLLIGTVLTVVGSGYLWLSYDLRQPDPGSSAVRPSGR